MFDAFGSLKITLAVFFTALFVAHVAFVMWKRSRKFWLIIDYAWLSVAGLALISATAQVRQLRATWEQNMLQEDIPGRKEMAFNNAMIYERLYREGFPYDTWQNRELVSKFRAAAKWFQAEAEAIKSDAYEDFLKAHGQIPTDDPPDLAAIKRQTIGYVQQVINLRKRETAAKVAAERSDSEQALFMLTPWIVAIALALRISKITAEWRGYRA